MAEWFKAPVLKTGVGQLTVGSNPSLSAEEKTDVKASVFFMVFFVVKMSSAFRECGSEGGDGLPDLFHCSFRARA